MVSHPSGACPLDHNEQTALLDAQVNFIQALRGLVVEGSALVKGLYHRHVVHQADRRRARGQAGDELVQGEELFDEYYAVDQFFGKQARDGFAADFKSPSFVRGV